VYSVFLNSSTFFNILCITLGRLKYAAITMPKYQRLNIAKICFSHILHVFGESVILLCYPSLCYPTQKCRMMENQLFGLLVVAKKVGGRHVVMCWHFGSDPYIIPHILHQSQQVTQPHLTSQGEENEILLTQKERSKN
jgi:hypothetical protein